MAHADFLRQLAPGTVVMHSLAYAQYHPLMMVRNKYVGESRVPVETRVTWNDIPVVVSDAMPPNGWCIVPGVPG